MKRIRRFAFAFALFLVLIIVLANTGRVGAIFGWIYFFPYGDKAAHFLLWGTMSLLVSLGFPPSRTRVAFLKALQSSLIIAAFATLEELSQALFPERSPSLIDLAAGLAGIFLFGEAGAWLRKRMLAQQRWAPGQSTAPGDYTKNGDL